MLQCRTRYGRVNTSSSPPYKHKSQSQSQSSNTAACSIGEERFQPLVKLIVENFVPSDYIIPEYAEELKSIRKELLDIYTNTDRDKLKAISAVKNKLRKFIAKFG
jgi:hypothetical protein